jgi:hypothetical protein
MILGSQLVSYAVGVAVYMSIFLYTTLDNDL